MTELTLLRQERHAGGFAQRVYTAAIAAGASESEALDLGELRLRDVQIGVAWAVADMYFAVSLDGVTYSPLHDGSAEYKVTAAAGKAIHLPSDLFDSQRFVKICSGPSAARVAQAAGVSLTIAARSL